MSFVHRSCSFTTDHLEKMGGLTMARARREAHEVRLEITRGIAEYCEAKEEPIRRRRCGTMIGSPSWKMLPLPKIARGDSPTSVTVPTRQDYATLPN